MDIQQSIQNDFIQFLLNVREENIIRDLQKPDEPMPKSIIVYTHYTNKREKIEFGLVYDNEYNPTKVTGIQLPGEHYELGTGPPGTECALHYWCFAYERYKRISIEINHDLISLSGLFWIANSGPYIKNVTVGMNTHFKG